MPLLPLPSTANNRMQISVAWSPTKLLDQMVWASTENWRIAGTPVPLADRQLVTDYVLHHFADLPHRMALTGANVVDRHTGAFRYLQRKQVSVSDICHMDVVSKAGTIGGGIITTVDLEAI